MLTGENGILLKAEKAKKETEISSIEEEIQIKVLEIQTQEDYEKNFYDKLQKKLQETDENAEINEYLDEKIKIITYKNHQFTIENYKVKHYSKCTYCENGQEEKDYVENDLFARYDGIENTRSGHSDSTTTWEDISGNNRDLKMTCNLNEHIYWEEDGLVQNTESSMVLKTEIIPEIQNLKESTVEIILRPDKDGTTISRDIFSIIQSSSDPYTGIGFDLVTNRGLGAGVHESNDNTEGLKQYQCDLNTPICLTLVSEDYNNGAGEIKLYVNGNKYAERQRKKEGFYIKDNASSYMAMFGFYPYCSYYENSFVGKIYSTRIYSKALTDEEISANFKIDKSLYNLNL